LASPFAAKKFTNFTQVPQLEGETAGKIVLDWMKANNRDLKVFAVSGGDPRQFWAQGRMNTFHQAIAKEIPDAKFVTSEANGLNLSSAASLCISRNSSWDSRPSAPNSVRQSEKFVHRAVDRLACSNRSRR
jgi:hypothetical protein